jgi:Transposase DDE domain
MEKKVDILVPGLKQRPYNFKKNKDHVALWKKPKRPEWMSLEEYQRYPNAIEIREFKIEGAIYITTLLASKKYPKKELRLLYLRRWNIETHLNSIKTTMKMDSLSCKSPTMIRKEIGMHFLAYNLIRNYIVQACLSHNTLPWHVSFSGTIQLLEHFLPLFAGGSALIKNKLYLEFMKLIITKKIGKRPGRVEPRLLKQRRQKFPNLKKTRHEERQRLIDIAMARARMAEDDNLGA